MNRIEKKWKISRKWIWGISVFLFILICPSFLIIGSSYSSLKPPDAISSLPYDFEQKRIAIVFGAGVRAKNPSLVYADRLDVSAELYFQKKISKILISGDNSDIHYNEPQIGKNYLTRKGIPAGDIILDSAGFRTHDTCARAQKIFGINRAYIVTQKFHLFRASFLCTRFGIESTGISSTLNEYSGDITNIFREYFAQQKAFYEVFVFPHDPKFLGDTEFIFQ